MKEFYSGHDVSNLLEQLGARPIAYHASFAKLTGSVVAGLMLSEALFCSLSPEGRKNKGWFAKPGEEWETEVGISRSEQETARKRLIASGLLEAKKEGMPLQVFYRVGQESLAAALSGLLRELSPEEIADVYSPLLSRLGALGESRARFTAESLKQRQEVRVPAIERFSYADIVLRDKATCHRCRTQIRLGPGRLTASLTFEYAVSLKSGGDHVPANVCCVHRNCSVEKRTDTTPTNLQQPALAFAEEIEQKSPKLTRAESSISLLLDDGNEYPISTESVERWRRLYPAVDVTQQLMAMRDWQISNPRKRKSIARIETFILRWLGSHQDRACDRQG